MKTTLMVVFCVALVSFANPAAADHSNRAERFRAWKAEAHQWISTYLPRKLQVVDMNDVDGVDLTTTTPTRAGAAWLRRSRNGADGRVMVNVGTAGNPYTVWLVVFNYPDACTGAFLLDADGNELTRCDAPDLGVEAVGASVYNASGAISQSDGNGGGVINIDFNAVAGNIPQGTCCFGEGIHRDNGFGAEVHVVVDRHPSIAAGGSWVVDLTTPFAGHRAAVFLPLD